MVAYGPWRSLRFNQVEQGLTFVFQDGEGDNDVIGEMDGDADVDVLGYEYLRQGLAAIARRVIGCHLSQQTIITMRVDDVAGNMPPGRYYSPCHRMQLTSTREGSSAC